MPLPPTVNGAADENDGIVATAYEFDPASTPKHPQALAPFQPFQVGVPEKLA